MVGGVNLFVVACAIEGEQQQLCIGGQRLSDRDLKKFLKGRDREADEK